MQDGHAQVLSEAAASNRKSPQAVVSQRLGDCRFQSLPLLPPCHRLQRIFSEKHAFSLPQPAIFPLHIRPAVWNHFVAENHTFQGADAPIFQNSATLAPSKNRRGRRSMKKHLLVCLLALALASLCMLPSRVQAAEETHNHCTCGADHVSIGVHTTDSSSWTKWKALTPDSNGHVTWPEGGNYYYLTGFDWRC